MQKKISRLFCFVNEYNYLELSNLPKNIQIIYRNYKKNTDISTLILLKKFCKKNNKELFISNNIKLALKYNLDGIYIPAFNNQLNYIKYSTPNNFKIIGSAHNINEISIKQKQGCKFIFISPIFKVKKTNYYLDIIKFNLLTLKKKCNFVALGGINSKNIRKLNLLDIAGFAGISFFQKKTAPKRGR
jgi:thiamine-phosphate pyrophosphorylase